MSGQPEKHIDESWKEIAEKEKKAVNNTGEPVPPEPDFAFFVTTFAIQASIFLGLMPNPTSNKKEQNLPQAKFIIDTLAMLKDKTKGNLKKEEEELLDNVIYELRMQYVALVQGGAASG
jgi:hypothetical protein